MFMLRITVFVDGPHILQPVDIVGLSSQELGAAEASTADPALTPRAWWKSNEAKTVTFGLHQSLAVLRDVLKADRYEVRIPCCPRLCSSPH